LTTSDLSERQLRATRGQLDQRWHTLSQQIGNALNLNRQKLSVGAEYPAGGAWAGLRGSACERVDRNRGRASFVAPLRELPQNLIAWLGFQEIWDVQDGRGRYAFRQLGITIHFGFQGDPIKPQVLRLEWPGLCDWSGAGIGFQSPGAGHPHWQLDILESLQTASADAEFDPGAAEVLENFDDVPVAPTVVELVNSLTFESMHLASAAPWWLGQTTEFGLHHMNAPSDHASLSRWLVNAIGYLYQELGRCVVRS
jgi:hypothetical protein